MKRLMFVVVLLMVVGCGRNNSENNATNNTTTPTTTEDMNMGSNTSTMDMTIADDMSSPDPDMNPPVGQDMVVMEDMSAPPEEDMSPPVEDMGDPPAEDMSTSNPFALRGSVSKGPFVLGSTVTVSELDDAGNPTGKTYVTQTTNQLGEFEVEIATPAPLLIEGQGFWFNELVGELSGANFTLRGYIAESSGGPQVGHVNIATHLASARVKSLISGGSSYPDAIAQAEGELVAALGIGPDDLMLGLSSDHKPLDASLEAAYAMALGVLFFHAAYKRQGSTEAEFQQLLNATQIDLADNGLLDGAAAGFPAELDEMQEWLDVRLTHAFLRRFIKEQLPMRDLEQDPLPDLNLVIDSDRDGFVNAIDTCVLEPNPDQMDSNNDGVGNACNFVYNHDVFAIGPAAVLSADDHPRHLMCGANRGIITPQPQFQCWTYDRGVASPFHKIPNFLFEPPEDLNSIVEVAAFEGQICAAAQNQGIRCWASVQDMSTTLDASGFGAFMNANGTCWLTGGTIDPPYNQRTGTVKCGMSLNNATTYTGRYTQVVTRGGFVCGLTAEKKLACRTRGSDAETPFAGGEDGDVLFEKITTHKTTEPGSSTIVVCGLRAAEDSRPGEISCYNVIQSSSSNQFIRLAYDVHPGTTFSDVALGKKACGIDAATKEIKCHEGEGPELGELHVPAGEFVRVVIADDVICGLTGIGRPVCNKLAQPFLTKPR